MVTLAPIGKEKIPTTFDGYPLKVALQKLLDGGAACVGVNCARGPNTMIPLMRHLKQEVKVGWSAYTNTLQISSLHNCCNKEEQWSKYYSGNDSARGHNFQYYCFPHNLESNIENSPLHLYLN